MGCEDVTLLIRDDSPKNALMKIGLDKDLAATLVADLIRSGINIERGCQVGTIDVPSSATSAAAKIKNNYIVPIKIGLKARGGKNDRPQNSKQEIKCDAYVAAVGRIPNTESLNLEAAGVQVDEYGGILVDSFLRAKGPTDGNVYGAGDVLGRPFLASTGVAQGVATIKNMFPPSPLLDDGVSDVVSTSTTTTDNDDVDEFCRVEDDLLSNAAACDPTTLAANPVSIYYYILSMIVLCCSQS